MSAEVIAIILSAIGLVVTLGGIIFAGLTWFLRRMDVRFEKLHYQFDKLDQRFDDLDYKQRAV